MILYSVLDESRTHDLSLRRRTLYPTELRRHPNDFNISLSKTRRILYNIISFLEERSMVKKVGLLVLFGLAFVVCILGNFPWYTKVLAGLTMLVSFIIVLTTDSNDLK